MSLPSIADNFKINKDWIPKKVNHPCYLYDFKKMGVTRKQFAKVISGKEAILFEKPLTEHIRSIKCPWCDFNEKKNKKHLNREAKAKYRGYSLRDHLYTHNKTIVDLQARKFQEELYTLRLALVREGYHEALSFFVDHECQICLDPQIEDRPNMCSIPESPRNRLRSLKLLDYPVEELYTLRKEKWSILGVIVLLKS
jgi:hypothetical protein